MKKNNIYTFIFEFDEGTFIRQENGLNLTEARNSWIKNLVDEQGLNFKEKEFKKLNEHFEEFDFVRLADCINVWCQTITLKRKLAIINVVKTVSD